MPLSRRTGNAAVHPHAVARVDAKAPSIGCSKIPAAILDELAPASQRLGTTTDLRARAIGRRTRTGRRSPKKRQTADWLRWIVTREGEDKHDQTLTVAFVEVNRATTRLNYRTSSNTRDTSCFAKSQQTTCLQRRRSRQSSAQSFCSQRITDKSPTSTNSECALEKRWRPGTQNTFGFGDHGGVRIRMRRSGVRLVRQRDRPPHPWSRLLRIRYS